MKHIEQVVPRLLGLFHFATKPISHSTTRPRKDINMVTRWVSIFAILCYTKEKSLPGGKPPPLLRLRALLTHDLILFACMPSTSKERFYHWYRYYVASENWDSVSLMLCLSSLELVWLFQSSCTLIMLLVCWIPYRLVIHFVTVTR